MIQVRRIGALVAVMLLVLGCTTGEAGPDAISSFAPASTAPTGGGTLPTPIRRTSVQSLTAEPSTSTAGSESEEASPAASVASPPTTSDPVVVTGPGTSRSEWNAQEPIRIEVASVNLDVAMGSVMDLVDGTVDPPTMEYAHRVRGISQPDTLPSPFADNTVFIAGHAWDRGEAAFTSLNDAQSGAEVVLTVADGSRLHYRILSVDVVPKGDIGAFAPAWEVRAGGLVLLTCSPAEDGSWPDNRVIIAEVVAGER